MPDSSSAKSSAAISWTVNEFEKKDRHPDWIWYAGLLFGLAAAIAFFYANIFFGIFLCIAGVVVIISARQEPKLLSIELGEKALTINGDALPYEKVVQFWLDETDKPDKLLLRVRGSFMPLLSLPLEGVSAEAVRDALAAKEIKEELIHESTSVKLFDRIGF